MASKWKVESAPIPDTPDATPAKWNVESAAVPDGATISAPTNPVGGFADKIQGGIVNHLMPLIGRQPAQTVGDVAGGLLPHSGTEAAIMAALAAIPGLGEMGGPIGAIAKSGLGRIGLTTGAGALGGALTPGETATGGAEQGAASGAIAEPINALIGVAGRKLGTERLLRKDAAKLGSELRNSLSQGLTLGGDAYAPFAAPTDTAQLEKLFTHGDAVEYLDQRMDRVKDAVEKATEDYRWGGSIGSEKSLPMPGVNLGKYDKPKTFRDIDNLIAKYNEQGWALSGDPRSSVKGKEMRQLSYSMREVLRNQLNEIKPGLGDAYITSRKKVAAANTLQRLFSEKGVFLPNGQLNQPKVADLTSRVYFKDLEQNLGRPATDNLLRMVRRNELGPVSDVPAEAGRGGISVSPFGVHPYMHPGHTYQPVGKVPQYMRPGGKPLGSAVNYLISQIFDQTIGEGSSSGADTR